MPEATPRPPAPRWRGVPALRAALPVPALAAALLCAGPAPAAVFVDPSLVVRETATSNANYGVGPAAESDDLTELIPAIVLRAVDPHLTVNGNLAVDAVDYRRRSEPNRVLPSGGFEGILQTLDDHFYVDAAISMAQYRSSIFAASPDSPTTYNTFTSGNARVSPIYKALLPGGVLLVLRADQSWMRGVGVAGSLGASDVDSNLARESVDLDSVPHPYGWSAHAETSATSYLSSGIAATRETLARGIAKATWAEDWILGLRLGVEQENFLTSTAARAIYGAGLTWQPSARTSLELVDERRFFGNGWTYGFRHTESRLGINLSGGRDVLTTAESILALPALGHDMSALLDAMLLSSTPDPIERARAVQQLLAQQNLPAANAAAFEAFEPTPVLVTSHRAALTWLGRESALSLSLYDVRTQLPGDLAAAVIVPGFSGENVQRGALLMLSRHLSPYTTVSASGTVTITDGLGSTNGSYTRQNGLTAQVNHHLGPRTEFFVGARLQAIESDVTPQAREKAAFVGAGHHF
jgi:uncharacterized protein (PEP-CTERM system associated)